ncbi:MAG: biotin transporter BioY [Tissierellia bacterium]|nr:biotin transporter BioY [Tissierellia bacterium]
MITKFKTKDLTMIALFTALIAIGAFISIPIGPVPFTMQNFFVFMAGLLLLPQHAFTSVLLYVLLGLIGLPIFAGFHGGPSMIFQPTFGFLIGFIVGAYIISKIAYHSPRLGTIVMALLLGEIVFYLIGLPYMYLYFNHMIHTPTDFSAILSMGLIPFIIPDMVKLGIATLVAPRLFKAIY